MSEKIRRGDILSSEKFMPLHITFDTNTIIVRTLIYEIIVIMVIYIFCTVPLKMDTEELRNPKNWTHIL
jgi:hypothetical protein